MALLLEKIFLNNNPYIDPTCNETEKLEQEIITHSIFIIFFLFYLVIIPLLVIITFFVGMLIFTFILIKFIFLLAIIGTVYWSFDTIITVIGHF